MGQPLLYGIKVIIAMCTHQLQLLDVCGFCHSLGVCCTYDCHNFGRYHKWMCNCSFCEYSP